ncbi:uroporphyrinogen-III synthase [Micromonospora sp. AKA38]|uniref:uroporphyrinogen-III synthase n=1 Tax=Micromonospora sp. AKA38 TaxID=2733861 RepID=UPI0022BE842A|nr:uroporphyrinogen-III synthase [Micromonospora sp. AKA38]GHJ15399.1 putative transcriptional regulatory protein [Micromonospora sp. AKA38]
MRDLAGYTIAVAAEHPGRHELSARLRAVGAWPVDVRPVRAVGPADPDAAAEATRRAVARPVHDVVVFSAPGLRAWLRVAQESGHGDRVAALFREARLVAHDARAADVLRELGVAPSRPPARHTARDPDRWLLDQPMAGRRVVAVVGSDHHREWCAALGRRGADVVEVATSRALPPPRAHELRRLWTGIVRGHVDAVALTGPATAVDLLRRADADGVLDDVRDALTDRVLVACLGPLTAAPLRERGMTPVVAAAPCLGSLLAALVEQVPGRGPTLDVDGHRMQIRSRSVAIDGLVVPVQAGPMTVLRVLARSPGRVTSCAEIRGASAAWSGVNDHAVEMAVSRLRRAFDDTPLAGVDLVQTVVRGGYRLIA